MLEREPEEGEEIGALDETEDRRREEKGRGESQQALTVFEKAT